jgi:hypothetical protein
LFPQSRLIELIRPIFDKMGLEPPHPETSNAFKVAVDGGRVTINIWGAHDGFLSIIAMPSTRVDLSDARRLAPLLASNAFCLDAAPLVTSVDAHGCLMIWARGPMDDMDGTAALALFDRVVQAGCAAQAWLDEPLPA